MYALVEIAGAQVKLSKGERVRVPRLDLEEGTEQTFTDVLMVSDDGSTEVGAPYVDGAAVKAAVVGHGRGDKVVVFKMKRRKNYRRRRGHRQDYTEIEVSDIVAGAGA